jgi:hypothetical protein
MFILNPVLELQSVANDNVLNVFKYNANSLTLLWFLSVTSYYAFFLIFTKFKIQNKKFLMFTDSISIIALSGSFSGILKYLNSNGFELIPIWALAIFCVSYLISKRDLLLKLISYTNYFCIVILCCLLYNNNVLFNDVISDLISNCSSVFLNAPKSDLINSYSGWFIGWCWLGARFMWYISNGHKPLNLFAVMLSIFTITCWIWFLLNEQSEIQINSYVLIGTAIISFITSLNALCKTITSQYLYVFMGIIFILVFFNLINVPVWCFYGFIISVVYFLGLYKWKKL